MRRFKNQNARQPAVSALTSLVRTGKLWAADAGLQVSAVVKSQERVQLVGGPKAIGSADETGPLAVTTSRTALARTLEVVQRGLLDLHNAASVTWVVLGAAGATAEELRPGVADRPK